ncbi:T9SS sorting signal type C domain-containing protein [Flavobacterium cellulosilyticum]|uniref:T9SS type A sorting domain-containing protein n=1 Tax=Flavobacterium cellulosilyticum TaxID=2541731 RepID=A0A4R5CME4_9FLAO|nr:T9SS sorting signal type C domain-containing protein [Flavobacterium cellulosilyticum]TDD99603.1 T9SS type A sorting domain-containing protein [Flavobacterium cellulosilyticum]
MNYDYLKNTFSIFIKTHTLILFLCLVLVGATGFGQISHSTPGTYTFIVPTGITSITVQAWGAGEDGKNNSDYGGGGGGAYAESTFKVTTGDTYTIIVGSHGDNGDNSSISVSSSPSTLLVKAEGGGKNAYHQGGKSSGSIGTIKYSGGDGHRSSIYYGGGGSSAGNTGNGSDAYFSNGGIGESGISGNGGNGNQTADNGTNPGGGGGEGRYKNGDGGNGKVIINGVPCPIFAISNLSATNTCISGTSIVTINADASSLPVGSYMVTYDKSSPSATALTASMTVSTAGTGSFTVSDLTTAGTITITISKLTLESCETTFSGKIAYLTVFANNTAGVASSSPTVCVNTPITNITHSTTGASGIGSPTGLPAGVTASWASNTITLSGAPTAIGVFNYSIPLSGGCSVDSATGIITVTGLTSTGVTICAGDSGFLTSAFVCENENPVSLTKLATAATTESGNVWDNPTNVYNNDNNFASSTIKSNSSAILSATNFDFSAIPDNASIITVQVAIGRKASKTNCIRDNSLFLIVGGVSEGINMADNSTYWPTSNSSSFYSYSPNNWGFPSLTVAQIKASNFGVAFSAKESTKSSKTASLDYISVEITYTVPGSLDWYTASSGGVKIGSGSFFNPVGISGSGLVDTNTPGTTTFFAACSTNSSCRNPTTFVINAIPVAPSPEVKQPSCTVKTGTITITAPAATGMSYSIDGVNYSNTSGIFTLVPIGIYNVTAKLNTGCVSIATAVEIKIPTNTWNGSSWSLGTPNSTQAIVFNGDYLSILDEDITACSCSVNVGKKVKINAGRNLIISNEVNVYGTLTFEDTASLVQINNVSNTNLGNIIYKRNTTKITKFDYTYWSTPVLPFSLGRVSPNTQGDKFYSFDSNIENWKQESAASLMVPGVGYIIRGPQNYIAPRPPSTYEAAFEGIPNNGHYEIKGINPERSYLLGNPYPSALDADTFLNANQNVLIGTIYFWTHNTPIAFGTPDPGSGLYAYSGNDYASYNSTGGVGTADNSSVPGINNDNIPNGKIATGQGFFGSSKTNIDGFVPGTPIIFDNMMRVGVIDVLKEDNLQFFKTRNFKTVKTIEKNRIWLNLTNTQGAFKQALVGYITDATNNYEDRFDGESYDGNDFLDFYSVNQGINLAIQGRALPFNDNDEVPLGYRVVVEGTFSVAIGKIDGLLSNQSVYLEDKLTNTIFDLKKGNYSFNTVAGIFNDRFVLKYKAADTTLGSTEFEAQVNNVLVSIKNKQITLNSFDETIVNVTIYDLLGRQIYQKTKVNSNELSIPNLISSHQTLVVKTSLKNGKTITNKIIL